MSWFRRSKPPRVRRQRKKEIPDGLWLKCDQCGEIVYRKELARNVSICAKCGFHFRISSRQYIEILLDDGVIEEIDAGLATVDPLGFPEYRTKLEEAQQRTGLREGIICGRGKIGGHSIVFAVTDFEFMGGSMGSLVGEKVARAVRVARLERLPLVIVTASGGGMRMQEGILSLMQMAKTSAALADLGRAEVPYFVVLTDPTMAGVMASFASLGDVILAEPGALLGFAGPRVIQQTIGEELPPGFQTSEFLLEHGMIDMVVSRKELKSMLTSILEFFDVGSQSA
jgi:acetyl-CoA carboxylase carboxyl transferase subunit beta